MTETLCTSGSVKLKCGVNVSTSLTASHYTELINQAESFINTETRYDWVNAYSTLGANYKKILEDTASSRASIVASCYDQNSYFSKAELQTQLDINWALYKEGLRLLKDKVYTDALKKTT